jgi:sec-independent protein translocase protein TatB
MLPEVGASELIVLAAVALIVVGPKDLPVLLRRVGQFVAKLRGFAADFRSSFDEMARQSELDELRKEVEALRNTANYVDTAPAIPSWDETHHALQPTDEPPTVTGADEPELAADHAAYAAEPAPSILPPAAPEAPATEAKPKAKPRARAKAKAKTAPEERA